MCDEASLLMVTCVERPPVCLSQADYQLSQLCCLLLLDQQGVVIDYVSVVAVNGWNDLGQWCIYKEDIIRDN